ncbi:MAG: hypothetical protein ABH830_02325 [Patescibacteria group bacterium]
MEILFRIIEIILAGVVGFLIQLLRNRPKITTHNCRISGKDVYTYFGSDNKPSRPACPYLINGRCGFLAVVSNLNLPDSEKLVIQKITAFQNQKCYLAEWNK